MRQNRCIILGCGNSAGIPSMSVTRPGGEWGSCDPLEPRNRRTRPSIYCEYQGLKLLVDTSPDLRQQYLDNKLGDLDAVLFTHEHSDHIGGLEALRDLYFSRGNRQIPLYASRRTLDELKMRYGYLFAGVPGFEIYPAVFQDHEISGLFEIKGRKIGVTEYEHGNTMSFGFRFGEFAYYTDFKTLTEKQINELKGVELLIIDATTLTERPTHSHLSQTLEYISEINPKRAYLTHLGRRMDYQTLCQILPEHIRPAYDGLVLNFS